MKQTIICSAIWFDDGVDTYVHQPKNIETGFVICGRRHHNCFTTIAILMGLKKERSFKDDIQGFLTSDDLFVSREEAWIIAEKAGQILENPNRFTTGRLFSEDLYKL